MSFSKAKLKRFNDVVGCTPPPTAYDPKLPGSSHAPSFYKEERFKTEQEQDGPNEDFNFLTPQSRLRSMSGTSIASTHSTSSASGKSKSASTDHFQCNKKIADLEKELRSILTERTALVKRNSQLEESLHRTEFQLAQHVKDKTHLESTIAALEKDAKDLQHGKAVLQQKLSSQEGSQDKKQTKQGMELQQQLAVVKEELSEAKAKLQKVEKERADLLKQKQSLEQTLESNRRNIEELKRETQQLTEKISLDSERSSMTAKEQSERYETQIVELRTAFEAEKAALVDQFEADKASIHKAWECKLQSAETAFMEQKAQAEANFQQERENLHREFDSYELTLTESHREVIEKLTLERQQTLETKTAEFDIEIQALRAEFVQEKAALQANFAIQLEKAKSLAENDCVGLQKAFEDKEKQLVEAHEKTLRKLTHLHEQEKTEWIAQAHQERETLDREWKSALEASFKRSEEFQLTLERHHAAELQNLEDKFLAEKELVKLDYENRLRETSTALTEALGQLEHTSQQLESVISEKNNVVNEFKAEKSELEAQNLQKVGELTSHYEELIKTLRSDFESRQLVLETAQKSEIEQITTDFESRMAKITQEFTHKATEQEERFGQEKLTLGLQLEEARKSYEGQVNEEKKIFLQKYTENLRQFEENFKAQLAEIEVQFEEDRFQLREQLDAEKAMVIETHSKELALVKDLYAENQRKLEESQERAITALKDSFAVDKLELLQEFAQEKAELIRNMEFDKLQVVQEHEGKYRQLDEAKNELEVKIRDDLAKFEADKERMNKEWEEKLEDLRRVQEAELGELKATLENVKNEYELQVEAVKTQCEDEKLRLEQAKTEDLAQKISEMKVNHEKALEGAKHEYEAQLAQIGENFNREKKEMLKDREELVEDYESKVEKLEALVKEEQDKFASLTEEMLIKENEFKEFKIQLANLRSEYEDERVKWEEHIRAKDAELSRMDETLKIKMEEIHHFSDERTKISEDLQRKDEDLNMKTEDLQQREEEIRRLAEECAKLSAELLQKDADLTRKNEELNMKNKDMKMKSGELEEVKILAHNHEEKISELEALNDKHLEGIFELKKILESKIEELGRVKTEEEVTRQLLAAEKAKVETEVEKQNELEGKFREQKALIEKYAEERVQETVAYWSSRLGDLKAEFTSTKDSMVTEFESEKAKILSDFKELQETLEDSFTREKTDLLTALAELREDLDCRQQALQSREDDLAAVTRERDEINDKLEQRNLVVKSLEDEVQQILKDLGKVNSRNASLSQALKKSEEERQGLKTKLADMDRRFNDEMKLIEEKLEEKQAKWISAAIQSEKVKWEEDSLALREQLASTQAELASLREQHAILVNLIGPFKEQLEMFETEKQALLNQKQDTLSAMDQLSSKYAELLGHQNQNQKIRHLIKLKEDIARLRKELANTQLELEKERKLRRKAESGNVTRRLPAAVGGADVTTVIPSTSASSTSSSNTAKPWSVKAGPPVKKLTNLGQNVENRAGGGGAFFIAMDQVDELAKQQEEEKEKNRKARAAASQAFDAFEVVFEDEPKNNKPSRETFVVPPVPTQQGMQGSVTHGKKPAPTREFLELPTSMLVNKRETMVIRRGIKISESEETETDNQENVCANLSLISAIDTPKGKRPVDRNAVLTASTPLRPRT